MNDLIDRQAAIKAVENLQDCYNGFSDTYDKACIICVLEELPSVDIPTDAAIKSVQSAQPEIIRCRECKHWEYDVIFADGWCRGKRQGNPEWFCADAERQE